MSQWEECSINDATHVEMGGKVHELGIADGYESKHQVLKYNRWGIEVYMESAGWQRIYAYAFPILGIKPLRKVKPKPIEFENEFIMYNGRWRPLYDLADRCAYQNCKQVKFKCIQIVEDEE